VGGCKALFNKLRTKKEFSFPVKYLAIKAIRQMMESSSDDVMDYSTNPGGMFF
jgi:hypothetical protein